MLKMIFLKSSLFCVKGNFEITFLHEPKEFLGNEQINLIKKHTLNDLEWHFQS